MGDDRGAIHDDVPFDWDGADALIQAFEQMAQEIGDQRALRLTAGRRALDRWEGRAVPLFLQRQTAGDTDAGELVDQLRAAAEDVRALVRAARGEQARRSAAREAGVEHLAPRLVALLPPAPEPHVSSRPGTVHERA